MPGCKHYKNIAPEKLGNLLKKADLKECSNPAHKSANISKSSSDLWFCLVCGFIGCSRASEAACSLKHFEKNKHNVCINPISLVIWCYACDSSIDEIIEDCENKGEVDNLTNFKDKITQLFFKISKELQKSKNIVVVAPDSSQSLASAEPEKSDVAVPNAKVIFGLKNIGNTCFFNSVMQCLNATEPLTNVYLDLKNFDVSDLKEDPSNPDSLTPNTDDWITVEKPKQAKNKPTKGSKGKNNTHFAPPRSSFINLCKNFQDFLVEARGKKDHIYDPKPLFSSISHLFSRFRGYSQQDAQELLRNFLDGLSTTEEKRFTQTELAQSRKGFKHRLTEIEKIFGGYLCNFVKCQDCKYVNRTFDFCLDIVLNIDRDKPKIVEPKKTKKKKQPSLQEVPAETEEQPQEKEEEKVPDGQAEAQPNYAQVDPSEIKDTNIPYYDPNLYDLYEPNIDEMTKNLPHSTTSETITLEEALKDFTSVEILNRQKNFYKCEHCEKEKKMSSGSARRFYIYDPPKVLTLVLKRYRQIGIGRFEKVNTQVKFEDKLILDPFVLLPVKKSQTEDVQNNNKPRFEYELFGIVVQSGNLNGGHYVSYTKHIINGEENWFYHSDTSFRGLKKEAVLKTQPYILFYRLK
jgi:ubiquitin carboxyl-terminal hydrolase 16/45